MPDIHNISPLLDGFQVGQSFSSHDGVSCYAALKTDTQERFILKQLSIPASQTQVDALLITGACKTEDQAREYFRSVLENTNQDIETLERLAAKPGFTPFTAWQVQEKKGEVGYDVYMLSPYCASLASRMAKGPITHLEAVNMGLDICAALSQCRNAGFLYQDLKPENIYITPQGRFTIGDLGFLSTDNLAYATIPDRFLGKFAAPELRDMLSAPNLSIDLYALGMILYHIYNGGAPFHDESSPEGAETRRLSGEALPAPIYADYEMAEIIQKACALKPEDRWATPDEMGQALTNYMQRNAISDNPIAPPIITDAPVPKEILEEAEVVPEEPMEAPAEEPAVEAVQEEVPEAPTAEPDEEIDILPILQMPDLPKPKPLVVDKAPEEVPDETPEPEEVPQEEVPEVQEEPDEVAVISETLLNPEEEDDTAPTEADIEGLELDPDDELAKMLAQAEELMQHNADLPTVTAPEVSQPEPEEEPVPTEMEEPAPESEEEAPNLKNKSGKKAGRWLGLVIGLLVAAILAASAYLFYNYYYLVSITSLQVTETGADRFAVTLVSDAGDDTFKLVCTDNYGNNHTAQLVDGVAVFENLTPNTQYTVKVTANGFHELRGYTSVTYSTGIETKFLQMTAVTGSEDGSVIVNFTVSGDDPANWFITTTADGAEGEPQSFSGHTATITGLEVGKEYTFTVKPDSEAIVSGTNTLTYTAKAVVTAQNLRLTSVGEGSLTVAWDLPDTEVAEWSVHYTQENGRSGVQTVTESSITLNDLDLSLPCTISVTAAEMSKPVTLTVPANPVVITSAEIAQVTSEDESGYTLSWTYEGAAPAGGWSVLYFCGQDESTRKSVTAQENLLGLTQLLPNTTYNFTIQTADGSCVLLDACTLTVPAAPEMDQYNVTPEKVTLELFRTPTAEELADEDFVAKFSTTYTLGQSVTVLLTCDGVEQKDTDSEIMTLIRNEDGVPVYTGTEVLDWADLWDKNDQATMNLSWACETEGTFTLELYVNSQLMKTSIFTVTAE